MPDDITEGRGDIVHLTNNKMKHEGYRTYSICWCYMKMVRESISKSTANRYFYQDGRRAIPVTGCTWNE